MLKHHFPIMASNTNKEMLTNKVVKISTWMNKVDKLASNHSYETTGEFDRDKFVGDAFEHLVEAMITWGRSDKAINCINVEPAEHDAPGVDLIGVGHDTTSVHTIQCKYRSNTMTDLTEGRDHIAMFPSSSLLKYNATYMTIWTTAKDLHRILDEEWDGKVKTIGFKQIRNLVDNNVAFWNFYADDLLNRN
jgi:hypothetical protein